MIIPFNYFLFMSLDTFRYGNILTMNEVDFLCVAHDPLLFFPIILSSLESAIEEKLFEKNPYICST